MRLYVERREKKDLETALSRLSDHGKGAIAGMDASSVSEAPVISAGNLGLDIALGVGAIPAEASRSMVLKHRILPWLFVPSRSTKS